MSSIFLICHKTFYFTKTKLLNMMTSKYSEGKHLQDTTFVMYSQEA